MLILLAIIIGLALGQHIKIAVSPDLMTFIKSSWSIANEKVPPVATLAAEKIKSVKANKYIRLGETV
jgi:hypothetical protein